MVQLQGPGIVPTGSLIWLMENPNDIEPSLMLLITIKGVCNKYPIVQPGKYPIVTVLKCTQVGEKECFYIFPSIKVSEHKTTTTENSSIKGHLRCVNIVIRWNLFEF